MPTRFFQDPNGRVKVAEQIGGAWMLRDASPDEYGDIEVPLTALDEATGGATVGQRATIKYLATNDSMARKMLDQYGYDVRPLPKHYGGGAFNFAIRKAGSADPWRPVDPDGFDWEDLIDIVGDAGKGVVEGAAAVGGFAVGGFPGAIAAGAGAGALVEMARQGIAAGVAPESFEAEPGLIGQEALIGGAAELASPLVRGVLRAGAATARGVGKLGLKVGSLIAGVQGRSFLPAPTMLYERARIPARVLDTFEEGARKLRENFTRYVKRPLMQERVLRDEMLGEAREAGAAVDLRSMMEYLESFMLREEGTVAKTVEQTVKSASKGSRTVARRGTVTDVLKGETSPFDRIVDVEDEAVEAFRTSTRTTTRPAMRASRDTLKTMIEQGDVTGDIPTQAAKLHEMITAWFTQNGVTDLAAVPPDVAYNTQQMVRSLAQTLGAFSKVPGQRKPFAKIATDLFHGIKSPLERAMDATGLTKTVTHSRRAPETVGYTSLMKKLSLKTREMAEFRKWMHGAGGASDPAGVSATESFIATLYGKSRSSPMSAMRHIEELFDLPLGTLERPVRRAHIGAGFLKPTGEGVPGVPELLPPLVTSGGGFRGAAFLGPSAGAILGLPGGPLGAGAGALLGGILSSPKLVLRATRAGIRLEPFVDAAARAGDAIYRSKTAHATAVAALRQAGAAMAPVVSEDSKVPARQGAVTVFGGS